MFKFYIDSTRWPSHAIETRDNEVVIFPAGESVPSGNYENVDAGCGISNQCFLIFSTDPKAGNMKKRCSKLRKEKGRALNQ